MVYDDHDGIDNDVEVMIVVLENEEEEPRRCQQVVMREVRLGQAACGQQRRKIYKEMMKDIFFFNFKEINVAGVVAGDTSLCSLRSSKI